MKSIKLIPLMTAAVLLCGCGNQPYSSCELFAMDTYITLTDCSGGGDNALNDAKDDLKHLEQLWSVNIPESDIARLNSGGSAQLSEETAGLLQFTLEMCEYTDGALDPTIYPVLWEWGFTAGSYRVPSDEEISSALGNTGWQRVELDGRSASLPAGMAVDTGAVAKGYAADLVAEKMKSGGITAGIIDLGGNVLVFGEKPDGSDWQISVRSPFGDGSAGTISAGECSVVTSGAYERYFEQDGVRYHHILDPATGRPADGGLESVTVIAKESKVCDALSTALFVMGEQGAQDFWREKGGFEMILITTDRRMIVTNGISGSFTPDKSAGLTEEVISP